MNFIDRATELALIRQHLMRPGAGLFVLFGRRRIGKTALLQHAISGIPQAAYHVATRSTIVEELSRLSATLSTAWEEPLLAAQPLASIEALTAFLISRKQGGVLILDELPYLLESEPAFAGMLQAAWDRELAKGQLKLIVCGSSIGMMENTFFAPNAPLFGRCTGQLRLGPLPPACLSEAFPWPVAERLELATIFGGVPGYLGRLSPDLNLVENIRRHIMTLGEPLYEEVPFLLREELREPRVYNAILASIAAGARKFGEISSKVGLDRANLTRYLGVLADLGLVEREVPVTERLPEKSRKGLYRIADPFVAAWFAFVYPHRDELERGLVDEVFDKHVRTGITNYLAQAIEPVLREMVRGEFGTGIVPFTIAYAGRHWSPTAELDLVLFDAQRRHAFVAEVKWSAKPISLALLDDLRLRTSRESAFSGVKVTYALVSRAGFTGRRKLMADERLIDISRAQI